jgi:hypothetical protein
LISFAVDFIVGLKTPPLWAEGFIQKPNEKCVKKKGRSVIIQDALLISQIKAS